MIRAHDASAAPREVIGMEATCGEPTTAKTLTGGFDSRRV